MRKTVNLAVKSSEKKAASKSSSALWRPPPISIYSAAIPNWGLTHEIDRGRICGWMLAFSLFYYTFVEMFYFIYYMKTHKRLLFLSFLPLLFISCSQRTVTNPLLLRADSLMECCPDSALSLLTAFVASVQHESRPTQMYYNLLLTKAQDKCFLTHTSDSLMKSVVDYYQKHGNTHQKMESLYYLASVYRDLGDAPRAIDCFLKAAETSEEQTEHRLLSRIYSQIGTLFFKQNLHKEGVEAYKKSYQHDVSLKDSSTIIYGLHEMNKVYIEISHVDSALYYYNKAIEIAKRTGNETIAEKVGVELADIYLRLNHLDSARTLLIESTVKKHLDDGLAGGRSYTKINNSDSAKHYHIRVVEFGNIQLEKDVPYFLEQYVSSNDSIKNFTTTESVKQLTSLYNYQLIENENNRLLLKNKEREMVAYTVFFVVVLGIIIACWLFLYYRKRKRMQLEQQQRVYFFKQQELQAEIEKKNKKMMELKQQLERSATENTQEVILLQQRLEETIRKHNQLVTQKKETENKFRSSSIYLLLHENCKNPSFRIKKHWEELQEEINLLYNNFSGRLYILYPKLSETELHVSLLIKAEIPLKDIARLLCKEPSAISNIRKRLYEKTHGEQGRAELWDDFIRKM
ncbi:hypothetical protein D0T50_04985 [Bacteroides sp. 214]|uniref:tetratricopeptide repeat protein n=1 Tax=Bacteroides sp. 214 TaxID=2302935 RepID=UPI0013D406BD|nr:tetratricopeptide repeat protein [Bacteroides sp. 214]NDW12243.1 hypothetical protein [Bacteroides sp. 214]